jgi:hypothetical protein
MTQTTTFHADLSPDGTTVTIGNEIHRHAFPLADLPKWIATYTALRDRNKGQFAKFYHPACNGLAALAARINKGTP